MKSMKKPTACPTRRQSQVVSKSLGCYSPVGRGGAMLEAVVGGKQRVAPPTHLQPDPAVPGAVHGEGRKVICSEIDSRQLSLCGVIEPFTCPNSHPTTATLALISVHCILVYCELSLPEMISMKVCWKSLLPSAPERARIHTAQNLSSCSTFFLTVQMLPALATFAAARPPTHRKRSRSQPKLKSSRIFLHARGAIVLSRGAPCAASPIHAVHGVQP